MKKAFLVAFTASALLATTPVFAIDFTQPLHTTSGGPFKDDKGQPTEILLGTVAENALMANDPDDAKDPAKVGTLKANNFWLAVKLHEKNSEKFSKDVILSAEEIAKIKDKIGKVYPTAIVGAAWTILDPASIPK